MAVDNLTILEKAWVEASNDFQLRVPQPSKAGIAATQKFLLDPMNNRFLNEFTGLMYQVGMTIVLARQFRNPLAIFKKEPLYYGNSVREVAADYIKAHAYNPCAEDVFKCENEEYLEWFHSINREDQYDWTINRLELRRALAGDGAGYDLNQLILLKTVQAINSDEYDEMNIMLQLISEAEHRWEGGLFKRKVADVTDQESAQAFLAQIRADAGALKFPSRTYNSIGVPVFARSSELVLLTTPSVTSIVDVYALAAAFNIDREQAPMRIVEVPELPIPNAVAMLTSEDFFECRDSFYEIDSIYNPKSKGTNYFLNHHGIYSMSPYVPAILYTTDAETDVNKVTVNITSLEVSVDKQTITEKEIQDGVKPRIITNYVGTVEGSDGSITIPTAAAIYEVKLKDGKKKVSTFVDDAGFLNIQKTGIEAGEEITIDVVGTYENPSGATPSLSGSVTVAVQANPEVLAASEPVKVATKSTK